MKRGAIEHPKTLALSEALNIPLYAAVGILECLWQWTAKYAPSGDIGKWPDSRIADGVFFERTQCAQLAHALRTSGFLDAHEQLRLVVHDWPQHCEDAVHMALARRIEYFWDGTRPSLSRLSEKERTEINKAYLNKPFTLTTVRTESAQEAHGVRTALALPSPALAIANTIDPPKAPPLGGDSLSVKLVRKRRAKSEPVRLTDQQQVWFGLFWAKYPRGDGKQNAAEAWAKGKLGETELDAILVALSWQIPDWEEKHQRNGYDPPHAATYLNQRRWEDKPPVNVGPKPEPVRTEQLDSSNEFIRRCAEMSRRFPNMDRSDIAEKVEIQMAEAEQVRKAAAAKRRNGTEQPVAVTDILNQVTEQIGVEP